MKSAMVHIILNEKKAGYESVHSAITALREQVDKVEVRVTYKYGDVERFVNDAIRDSVATYHYWRWRWKC
jgi:diacylglycerol kinase family enzyme